MKSPLRFAVCMIIVWCNFLTISRAQQLAMFEHPVYFEDGMGNRDTIIIGGDTTAALGLNPEFGEVPLNTPFDSVFEVRTISEIEWWKADPILTKKYVGWSEKVFGFPEPCEIIEWVRFVIHIEHLPLKVSWDSKLYSDSLCILASYLTSGAYAITIGAYTLSLNPEDENLAYCVAQNDSIIFDIGQGLYVGNLYNEFIYEVEGGTVDTMLILEWGFDHSGSSLACGEIVSAPIIPKTAALFSVYPNPTSDEIFVEWDDPSLQPKDIRIYASNGQFISNYTTGNSAMNRIEIDVRPWFPGIYYLQFISDTNVTATKVIRL